MLAQGMDPNTVGPNGEPALVLAARAGYAATVDALLAAKANVNARNAVGDTAIMARGAARPPRYREEAARARRRRSTTRAGRR